MIMGAGKTTVVAPLLAMMQGVVHCHSFTIDKLSSDVPPFVDGFWHTMDINLATHRELQLYPPRPF